METQTRYDLNAAIENWRVELAAQTGLTVDDRRELETHLRDAIVGFQQRGLNDEESFLLARHRVGPPRQLDEEFVKDNPAAVWRERVFWMVSAILFTAISNCLFFIPVQLFHSSVDATWFNLGQVLYLGIILGILWLLVSGRLEKLTSFITVFSKTQLRLATTLISVVVVSRLISASTLFWSINNSGGTVVGGSPYFWSVQLYGVIYNLLLVALLIWLLPPQNQKAPKRT
jgi:magnesium-transporting ATPase (P-type)